MKTGNLHGMLVSLRRLFASIPYNLHVDEEAYYHSIFYAVMTVLEYDIIAEDSVRNTPAAARRYTKRSLRSSAGET